jgi:hypothetical protein
MPGAAIAHIEPEWLFMLRRRSAIRFRKGLSNVNLDNGVTPAQARFGAVFMFSGWQRLILARCGWLCLICAQVGVGRCGLACRRAVRLPAA